jgi:hypothetical protein
MRVIDRVLTPSIRLKGNRRNIIFEIGLRVIAAHACADNKVPFPIQKSLGNELSANDMLFGKSVPRQFFPAIGARPVCQNGRAV